MTGEQKSISARVLMAFVTIILLGSCGGTEPVPEPETSDLYEPTLESLQQHEIPEWYDNAKLGIFIHWGL